MTPITAAFLDESESNRRNDPNVYILAAALIDLQWIDDVRQRVADLADKGQVKLHWSQESHKKRWVIISALAAMPVRYIAVTQSSSGETRAERLRGLAIKCMLQRLDGEVTTAVFESRGPKPDDRDRRRAQSLSDSKLLHCPPRIEHRLGRDDPMLWVADAACGAVTAHRAGNSIFLDHLREQAIFQMIEST